MNRLLLGVTGGIAAVKAALIVRQAIEAGFEVRCALSRSAESFVTPLSLEVLSGRAVDRQEYLSATGTGEEAHIEAADWADVVCIAPATAHLISRLALGLADDFLTTVALAFEGPIVLAPAMHHRMWGQPRIRRNVEELRERGVLMVGPVHGKLASGEVGIGRMAEPEAIVALVSGLHRQRRFEGKRVVVTAGPTYEPIDPVRFLGNRSSGKMGFSIARQAAREGAQVTLVSGPVALSTPVGVDRVDVETALEMRDATYQYVGAADVVVMTAAVADYRVETATSKIKRHRGVPQLRLIENPDILAGIAEQAPEIVRVGFAAETEPSAEEAQRKLEAKRLDLLVWNNVAVDGIGFGSEDNEVTVYDRRAGVEPIFFSRRPKPELAADLLGVIAELLESSHET